MAQNEMDRQKLEEKDLEEVAGGAGVRPIIAVCDCANASCDCSDCAECAAQTA
jgi:hypothetical protein